ncbi:4-coumarate--CoA ligase 1 isoform X2 [Aphidius gifuensis]|uniref:4-coumarate--CoA ligase 1 isoform X2 n=1 Tax=Aphidius gifuensis TaxID=684658 RepID=UPI001CDB6AC8|nr:4-coumarate--CoA ligase 1 isoform X2 [Aphidius gifuensis]
MTEDYVLNGPPGFNLPNISLGQFILDKLVKNPLSIVQVNAKTGEILTSHDLLKKSVRLAVSLDERYHCKPGDTIAISSENNCDFFIAVCAGLFRGACIAPINSSYLKDEIHHCLNISKPKIIFVSQKTSKLIHDVIKNSSWNIEIIQFELGTIESNESIMMNDIIGGSKIWPDEFFYRAEIIDNPCDIEAVILCSSGTTGLPKGVMLSHKNMLAIIYAMEDLKNGTVLLTIPFFHGYGLATMLSIISRGLTVVFMSSFDPQLFCQTIQKYRINSIPLVPPIMSFLAKHPMISQFDFSSVKEITCGAASLSREILIAVKKRFNNNIVIRQGYGMTELSVAVSITPPDSAEFKPDSVGLLTPGTQCKVIDPSTSVSLGPNKIGELCFKGDHVMIGYKDNYQATNDTIDENKWLHTGDLGYYDNEKYLYIVGRIKELIKYNGFQISPAEIENYLLKHSSVIDAAVVGKNDETCGQLPVAFVVKKHNSTVTPDELRAYIDERVSSPKRLRGGVVFVNEIPKNPSGKILRKKLEKLLQSKL